jgi:hypothetical protein
MGMAGDIRAFTPVFIGAKPGHRVDEVSTKSHCCQRVFPCINLWGWHTFLDMLGAALRGDPAGPRQAHMQRNAERYGVDLSNLVR